MTCIDSVNIEIRSIFIVIMSVPVSQLTIEQAHKDFNSLADKIAAKYEQLDFGAFGTTAFNVKLLNWLSCLLIWLNFVKDWPANAKTTSQVAIL